MMTFEDLQKLIVHVLKAKSPLYRNLGVKEVRTWEDWHALPLLTKDALLAMQWEERIFIPQGEVDHVRPSSGTSGKPPLFSPRTPLRGMEYRTNYHDFKSAILAFTVPIMPHWHESFQESLGAQRKVVVFDPKEPGASVRLAKAAGVTSISVFAFHMLAIAEQMQKLGMTEQIKFIELAGEACTRLLFESLRKTFPNATIIPFYGASEVEDSPLGVPCRPINGTEPMALYHCKKSHYIEVIDPDREKVLQLAPGLEGELVFTAYPGEPSALPLVRFKTGDMVRIIDNQCEHHEWSYTVLGRAVLDFLKVPGGVLRVDEVERVLRSLNISDRFEIHTFEHDTPQGPKLQVELHLEAPESELQKLAEIIQQKVRLGPSYLFETAVLEDRLLPLICVKFKNPPIGRKQKRLVKHIGAI